jgi:hypothetical protein
MISRIYKRLENVSYWCWIYWSACGLMGWIVGQGVGQAIR